MTKEQEQELLWKGTCTLSPPISLPVGPQLACPKPYDRMEHVEALAPDDPKNYNQLSVDDMQALHMLKGMDRLHQLDTTASEYYKGVKSKNEYDNPQTQEQLAKRSVLNDVIQKIQKQKKK